MSIQHVIAQYLLPTVVQRVESLDGHGGFSGAALWRLAADQSSKNDGLFCLRRWPRQHPTRAHLQWIHRTINAVRDAGFRIVPAYYRTRASDTILEFDGHLWELGDWLPGEAVNSHNVSGDQLTAAMQVLAEFHLAASRTNDVVRIGRSRAARWRWDRFQQLSSGGIEELAASGANHATLAGNEALAIDVVTELVGGFQLMAPHAQDVLAKATTIETPLQPCLRDIWYEHVLFDGDTVTGLVDFGAMRYESVAVDVARLLGSYAGAHQSRWHQGLKAYEAVRLLSDGERQLTEAIDMANALMAGLQWVAWICMEGRQFENMGSVARRMAENRDRLTSLSRSNL